MEENRDNQPLDEGKDPLFDEGIDPVSAETILTALAAPPAQAELNVPPQEPQYTNHGGYSSFPLEIYGVYDLILQEILSSYDSSTPVNYQPEAGPSRHANAIPEALADPINHQPEAGPGQVTPDHAPKAGTSQVAPDQAPEVGPSQLAPDRQQAEGPTSSREVREEMGEEPAPEVEPDVQERARRLYEYYSPACRLQDPGDLPQRHHRAWILYWEEGQVTLSQGRGTPARPSEQACGVLRRPEDAEDDYEPPILSEEDDTPDLEEDTPDETNAEIRGVIRKREDDEDDEQQEQQLSRAAGKRRRA
ncbi:hypothetical protein PCANC_03805 [Puccinia coronata f. sp. avenae]|uniref:Uncharacterized protein n=1 Tax=Puccinia coronata f. sp. avenae TaxID=200324 RepID=A0A2N5T7H5_9BASI|nr:hypothetical protein PCANC_03805 [Puccinia coronata f. sp. avenae]